MAVYAVGDIQGCLKPLKMLLDKLHFSPQTDRLWIAGDMVNRGPHSLETLRFIYHIRHAVVAVLGNHDLHLLALAMGCRQPNPADTLQPILDAPDRDRLLDWLRRQPLLHHDKALGYTMVHAGIPPQWSIAQSCYYAAEVAAVLTGDHYTTFLQHMYGNQPNKWDESLTGHDRWRVITNYFTRMRFCTADGQLELTAKGTIDHGPQGYLPWFQQADRKAHNDNIIFGHWAALEGSVCEKNLFALDSGCVWGKALTAMRLDDKTMVSIPCSPATTYDFHTQ